MVRSSWRRTAYLGYIAAVGMFVLLVFSAYGRSGAADAPARLAPEVIPMIMLSFICGLYLPILSMGAFFLTLRELFVPPSHVIIRPLIGLLVSAGVILQLVGVVIVEMGAIDPDVLDAYSINTLVEGFFNMGGISFVMAVLLFGIVFRSVAVLPAYLSPMTFGFGMVAFGMGLFLEEPRLITGLSAIIMPIWVVIIASLLLFYEKRLMGHEATPAQSMQQSLQDSTLN